MSAAALSREDHPELLSLLDEESRGGEVLAEAWFRAYFQSGHDRAHCLSPELELQEGRGTHPVHCCITRGQHIAGVRRNVQDAWTNGTCIPQHLPLPGHLQSPAKQLGWGL